MEDENSQTAIDALKAITRPGALVGEALAKTGINPFVLDILEKMQDLSIIGTIEDSDTMSALSAVSTILETAIKLGPQAIITETIGAGMAAARVENLHRAFIKDMAEKGTPGFAVQTITIDGEEATVYIDSTGTLFGESTTYYVEHATTQNNREGMSPAAVKIQSEIDEAISATEQSIAGMTQREVIGEIYARRYGPEYPDPRDYPELPLTKDNIKPTNDFGV